MKLMEIIPNKIILSINVLYFYEVNPIYLCYYLYVHFHLINYFDCLYFFDDFIFNLLEAFLYSCLHLQIQIHLVKLWFLFISNFDHLLLLNLFDYFI
jgi:hypothetical protein